VKTFSIVKSENVDVAFVIMMHQHAEFEQGKVDRPSVVLCECDTVEHANIVLQALRASEK
jgi:hypothetical protein